MGCIAHTASIGPATSYAGEPIFIYPSTSYAGEPIYIYPRAVLLSLCRYMIEMLGWDPEEAIKAFDLSRGHTQVW